VEFASFDVMFVVLSIGLVVLFCSVRQSEFFSLLGNLNLIFTGEL